MNIRCGGGVYVLDYALCGKFPQFQQQKKDLAQF